VTPNQSLYIQNLNEKLQKNDLRRNLYMLFSTYGPVLDVNALRTSKMRGQAHVLFRDAQTATQAMRHCQGLDFFGRNMRISYAKGRSHTLAKLTGTFVDPTQEAKAKAKETDASGSFPAPPGGPPAGLPPPPGLQPVKGGAENAASPALSAGTKRLREESDDEGDAPMEEDSEGGEMEMSDED